MRRSRNGSSAAAISLVVALALLLTGCGPQRHVVTGSDVTIASNQAFTSLNPVTSYGNTIANRSIDHVTNSRFNYYDNTSTLVRDESFGSYRVLGEDPLTVRYEIAGGVTWSDGVPVDSADLLLAWAANSGRFSTEGFSATDFVNQETGEYTDNFPRDVVYFDGAPASGLSRVSQLPELGSDGRSITLVYDEYFVDWELAFQVGMPAHVVGERALGGDPTAAKAAVIDAITTGDESDLARISRVWNSDFNLERMPRDEQLLVGTGPYTITAIEEGESVTLTANPAYRGRNQPSIESVVVRTISDPLAAIAALEQGDVDVIAPASTPDVLSALDSVDGVTVETGVGGTWEHLDLQFEGGRNGVFDDPLVREAFLRVIPRQEILDELVTPLVEDAELLDSLVFLPGMDGYDVAVASNGSRDFQRVDVPGARKLLEQAGVTAPTVCMLFDPANPRRVAEFQLITDSAARAGFVVTNCSRASWTEFLGLPGSYDAALFGWNTSNLAVSAAEARLRSDSPISNYNSFARPEVDSLLDEIAASSDPAVQREQLARVDELLWSEAYGLPLYQFPVVTAWTDRVTGVAPSTLDPGLVWNLWDWQPSADSE
ncbi:ABC transporter family substrate-binding protein [Glaciihabitans arcticus]|uniref:ABC transporter family substrate-binding protein n=1 Tax=Glaciihabitans arcticus TaxID=2668039 RepID=A0A4Q9GVX3_9MICO|nr:ABC transporter family substrate-binding protein [Glaciihabitans arcticus]TBN57347.1 ABC transporter family substrate-binding protein [Glaciihabitans arcticus]